MFKKQNPQCTVCQQWPIKTARMMHVRITGHCGT